MATELESDKGFKELLRKMEGDNAPIFKGLRTITPETDERTMVIVYGAAIDFYLEKLLKQCVKQFKNELFDFNQPLGTFSSRIEISYALGFIDENLYKVFTFIRKIRNNCAHELTIDIHTSPIVNWINEIMKIYKPYKSYIEDVRSSLKASNETFYGYLKKHPNDDFTPNDLRLVLHLILARLLNFKPVLEIQQKNKPITLLPDEIKFKKNGIRAFDFTHGAYININGGSLNDDFELSFSFMQPIRDILKPLKIIEFYINEECTLKGIVKYNRIHEVSVLQIIELKSNETVFSMLLEIDSLNSVTVIKTDKTIVFQGNETKSCYTLTEKEISNIKLGSIYPSSDFYLSQCNLKHDSCAFDISPELWDKHESGILGTIIFAEFQIYLINPSVDTINSMIYIKK